ncbi:two-component regulator propeller domain-containing protein [Plebeiibacterium marinum]|uniref:histidine kinase n=1 Tax=Plebeiibacterium marinum TaxID=2992111 RepID=A0AAE3MFA3_9BACT|nr:two-component regulator propeller domain-containing protein [Plebeiobacterium marinum]MCW3806356.1 response regulator [Plebeiobacterium marinum]
MENLKKYIFLVLLLLSPLFSKGQDIYRFEHFDTEDGLSQGTVSSMLCDKKGFLWIGTRDGLNRYDGNNFKVYIQNTFANNRIIKLWQDSLDYIWLETYDHYLHAFNPRKEIFKSVPDYKAPDYNKIKESSCFRQYSNNEIWIGTSGRGIYYLKHDPKQDTYNNTQISDKGRYTITNNTVRFIIVDQDSSVWVGAQKGINLLTKKDFRNNTFNFQHLFINYSFNSAVETDKEIWFSTESNGIITYDKKTGSYHFLNAFNAPYISTNNILKLIKSQNGKIFIALKDQGVIAFDTHSNQWENIEIHGNNVDQIYFDRYNNAWVTSDQYGVTRVDMNSYESETYLIKKHKAITDLERHVFYEDKDSNLWVGLHGGALSFYDRQRNTFVNYSNDPNNNYSISSDIVHCITEDKTGLMWVGTGQYKGGLEKIIKRNPAFQHLLLKENISQITDNLVRSISEDRNGCIWCGTKSGELFILDKQLNIVHQYGYKNPLFKDILNTNIYSIFFDNNNYIWLGSKGQGLFVSTSPLPNNINQYQNIEFINYKAEQNDPSSLCNNNIYSFEQDYMNNIWIGTFGNGISITTPEDITSLKFKNLNSSNSQLSNNLVRQVKTDSDSNIWVATSFGLNVLFADSLSSNNFSFKKYLKNIESVNSITYNDIIEIFEDSEKQIWFGTSGGGVSRIKLPLTDSIQFTNLTTKDGLSNNAIFGIQEDENQSIWFSTEYGLNRYDKHNQNFEIFNESNGLSFNGFSENTSYKQKNGYLLFGGANGIEIIKPQLLQIPDIQNNIELTNFQLFNKDVVIGDKNSPLMQSITFTEQIKLTYKQSSFSIEYSTLDYLDPGKIQYAFMLEGFEDQWNYVGNQTKATYTNLPPGNYTFLVKNTDRKGQWKTTPQKLMVEILPPWWKTIWAYILYALLLIGLLLIVRTIVTQINKYRNDLILEKKINELKLRFFTNISHEIRTPLTLILGPLEDILEENSLSDNIKQQMILMRKNTKRMLHLVNQLLDFRRIQNNKLNLKVQEIYLNEFVQNIYNSFIPLAKHNGITFKFHPYNADIPIWADPIQLDTILYNLISNALKYTPRGKSVAITLSEDNDLNLAKINVSDEGPGIPNEHISDIFTRYVILNNKNNMSSGIGLSLAFELAKLHGGNIDLKSEPGQGSSFCLTLPLDKEKIIQQANVTAIQDGQKIQIESHSEEITYTPDYLNKNAIDKNKATILIVEDNAPILSYIKSKLLKNYNCLVANNGIEGLEIAERNNPDIIVTDIMMPQMDGTEMTKKLKENFSTCHIPVIMMTAKSDIQDKISGYETGAEAYITKPLNSSYLKAVIESLIKQRKLVISKFRDNKTVDPKTLKVNSKDEEFLQNLLKFVEENYSMDLSIEKVTEYCCVSRTVLYNKVKGLTGLSPLEFIRQIKLKIAHEFLVKGYPVADAAFKIGYTDVKYFSRQFKMMYGYPPSKLKK